MDDVTALGWWGVPLAVLGGMLAASLASLLLVPALHVLVEALRRRPEAAE